MKSKTILKTIAFLLTLFFSLTAVASTQTDTTFDTHKANSYYKITNEENTKLIIFLHGGVTNPVFKQSSDNINLSYLIEGNIHFVQKAVQDSFDLILPITNDSLDWLNRPQQAFNAIKEYIESMSKKYSEIYIAGFSDGGTGSYKIFYTNSDYFGGLIVLNGYPFHLNFNKSVDHSKVSNKKIMFFGTTKDKVIRYEFLLIEYCKQKETNANTYFYLAEGDHSFKNYTGNDLDQIFGILTGEINNTKTEVLQGYIKNDVLVKLYPFRKKFVKDYRIGQEVYVENKLQQKKYK